MQVDYQKMHGTGNVILVIDQRVKNLQPPDVSAIRKLGNERTGPGFDQLMWIAPSDADHFVATYRVYNADGSEVEQCGNGVRCVARYLSSKDKLPNQYTLKSPAGAVAVRVLDSGQVAVSMGAPVFDPARIPFVAARAELLYPLVVDSETLSVSALSMGNPHCILQVDEAASAPVALLGSLIECHERFPNRTNVGFMHVSGPQVIELRVHERGVGETLACGTGACAAVVTGRRLGLLDDDVRVRLPGGEVMVSWRGDNDPVWLTGDAELISHGTIDLAE